MTGIDDWQDLMDYPRLIKVADFSYFYILFTDGRTDRRTLVLVKLLSRLKNSKLIKATNTGSVRRQRFDTTKNLKPNLR